MANQGLSQVLPYKFRNTGSKPGSVTNILQAPSLILLEVSLPLPAALNAVIARTDGEPEVIKTDTQKLEGHPILTQLLKNESDTILLWEVGIWAGRIEFNFRNKTLRALKPDPKIATSKISIDASPGSQFKILAPAFDKGTSRQLFCEYGEDVVYGKNVRIVEFEDGRGVHDATFYPQADEECFEKIIQA